MPSKLKKNKHFKTECEETRGATRRLEEIPKRCLHLTGISEVIELLRFRTYLKQSVRKRGSHS